MLTILVIWVVGFGFIGVFVGMTNLDGDSVISRFINLMSSRNAFGKFQLLLGSIMLLPLMIGETISRAGMYIGDILWELGEKKSK